MIHGMVNINYGTISPADFSAYDPLYKTSAAKEYAANAFAAGKSAAEQFTAEKSGEKKAGYISSPEECQTCKNRKYQDGSDENVSFKAAAHIDPKAAAGVVRAHEGEHVSNAYTKAARENGKVLNASVTLRTSVCQECGKPYVSGGTTRTLIKYGNEDNDYAKNLKAWQAVAVTGQNFDVLLK